MQWRLQGRGEVRSDALCCCSVVIVISASLDGVGETLAFRS